MFQLSKDGAGFRNHQWVDFSWETLNWKPARFSHEDYGRKPRVFSKKNNQLKETVTLP